MRRIHEPSSILVEFNIVHMTLFNGVNPFNHPLNYLCQRRGVFDMGRLSLSPAHLDLRKCGMKNHMNCSYVHLLKYDALSVILCHH